jgi:hypothetical protein
MNLEQFITVYQLSYDESIALGKTHEEGHKSAIMTVANSAMSVSLSELPGFQDFLRDPPTGVLCVGIFAEKYASCRFQGQTCEASHREAVNLVRSTMQSMVEDIIENKLQTPPCNEEV